MSQLDIADLFCTRDIGSFVNVFTEQTEMIGRKLKKSIENKLFKDKAIVINGARQTGKTALVHQILEDQKDVIHLNCDEPVV